MQNASQSVVLVCKIQQIEKVRTQLHPVLLSFLISWMIKLPNALANRQVIATAVATGLKLEVMYISARPSSYLPGQFLPVLFFLLIAIETKKNTYSTQLSFKMVEPLKSEEQT